jgi:hypothetical protein
VKAESLRQRALPLDFGIVEVLLVGPRDNEVYLVRFVCGCVGVIAGGRMIRRSGVFTLVCTHVTED